MQKKIKLLIGVLFLTFSTFAQSPEKMSYQSLIRNSADVVLSNEVVHMKISILQSSADGVMLYEETQTTQTNINGLVSIEIGSGLADSFSFSSIDWSLDTSYYIKIETDIDDDLSYDISTISQLLSVPYALYAKTSGSSTPGPQGADGAKGDPGEAGADGSDGNDGATGSTPDGTLVGQMNYWNGTTWQTINPRTSGAVLQLVGTIPTWVSNADIIAPVITVTPGLDTVDQGVTWTDAGATADTGETVTASGTVDTSTAGSYTITYTVSDASGNTGTATRTVTVVDTTALVITVTSGIDTVEQGATWTDAGATADSGETVTASGTVDTNTTGTYTITYTATDAAGNTGTATRTVTVVDTTAPVITVTPGTDTVEQGSTWTDAGATADGDETVTVSGTVDTSNGGTYIITYSATDASGNTGTATRTVTVVDTTAPVITVTSGTDTVERLSTWTDAGATADGGETVTASGTVDTNTTGTYTITYTATDASGNTGTATRTVTVLDTTAPVITVTSGTDTVEKGTTWTDAGATADAGETVTSSGTVDINTSGTYTITYMAIDAAGNTGTATRTVTVVDTTAPVITPNISSIYTGSNDYPGQNNSNVRIGWVKDSFAEIVFDAGGYDPLSPSVVEFKGTEYTVSAGNSYGKATQLTQLLTDDGVTGHTNKGTYITLANSALANSAFDDYVAVFSASTNFSFYDDPVTGGGGYVDNGAIPITVTSGTDTVEKGTTWTDSGATADTGETVTASGTVDTSTIGSYTITYTATDASGNTGTATRTVTVVDTTAPVITVTPGTDTVERLSTWTDAGATADGGETVTASGTVDTNTTGTYTITYTATDASGNTGTATRTVTVVDTTAPVITVTPGTDTVAQNATWTDAGATADGGETVTASGTVDMSTAGTYTITYTATDASGNQGTITRTVTIVAIPSVTNVLGSNNENQQINISWTTGSGGTASGFKVEYKEVYPSVGSWILATESATGSSYLVTNLTNFSKAYKFRVSAIVDPFVGEATESANSFTPRNLQLPQSWTNINSYLMANGSAITADNQGSGKAYGNYRIDMNNYNEQGSGQWYRLPGTHNTGMSSSTVAPASVTAPMVLVTNNSGDVIYKINPTGDGGNTFYGPGYTNDNTTSIPYFFQSVTPPTTNPPEGNPGAGGGSWNSGPTTGGGRRIIDDARLNLGYGWNWITSFPANSSSSYSFSSSALYTSIINIPPDTTAPVITVTSGTDTVEQGATWTDAGATADGGETVTASGTVDTNTLGTYTITYSAEDASGNVGTATRTVTVVDTTAPVITVTSGTDTVAQNATWTDAGATADGDETVTASGTVDTSNIGLYTITYTATDAAGNTGTATRIVTVVDTTAPVITVTSGTDTVEGGSTWTDAGATADTGETVTSSGAVDTNTLGTYTITYTATDAAGNTGTATRTVTVVITETVNDSAPYGGAEGTIWSDRNYNWQEGTGQILSFTSSQTGALTQLKFDQSAMVNGYYLGEAAYSLRGVQMKVTNENTGATATVTIDPQDHGAGDFLGGAPYLTGTNSVGLSFYPYVSSDWPETPNAPFLIFKFNLTVNAGDVISMEPITHGQQFKTDYNQAGSTWIPEYTSGDNRFGKYYRWYEPNYYFLRPAIYELGVNVTYTPQ